MDTRGQAVTFPNTIDILGRKENEGRSRPERRTLSAGCVPCVYCVRFVVVERADKAKALTSNSANQPLFSAIVADRMTRRVDADAEHSIEDNPPPRNGLQEIITTDDSFTVLDQILQQIENLRLNQSNGGAVVQLAALGVESKISKSIDQVSCSVCPTGRAKTYCDPASPACWTILPQRVFSETMKAWSSAGGGLTTGTTPILSAISLSFGDSMMLLSSLWSLSTIAVGVPAGPASMNHPAASKSGTPASLSGGISGATDTGAKVVTPSARRLPARINERTGATSEKHLRLDGAQRVRAAQLPALGVENTIVEPVDHGLSPAGGRLIRHQL